MGRVAKLSAVNSVEYFLSLRLKDAAQRTALEPRAKEAEAAAAPEDSLAAEPATAADKSHTLRAEQRKVKSTNKTNW